MFRLEGTDVAGMTLWPHHAALIAVIHRCGGANCIITCINRHTARKQRERLSSTTIVLERTELEVSVVHLRKALATANIRCEIMGAVGAEGSPARSVKQRVLHNRDATRSVPDTSKAIWTDDSAI